MISCRNRARMALWQMPDGLRVEHALQSGSEIPPFYDSMIAKIISHGATRDEARRKLICGLEQHGGLRRHHQSGVSRRLPAASRLRVRRSDDGFHRQISRRPAGAAQGRRLGSRARGAALVCDRCQRAAVAERTDAGGDVSNSRPHRARSRHPRSRNRARARRHLCRQYRWRRVPVRDRRARPCCHSHSASTA